MIAVAGIKILYLYFKGAPERTKSAVKRERKSAPAEKPVRSIEINPDEVDKIFVKKIS